MEETGGANSVVPKPPKLQSLATKFSVFTALLVVWTAAVQLSYHWTRKCFSVEEHLLLCLALLVIAVAIARFTSRVFVRPLKVLQDAMSSVGEGLLEPVRISRTGDEIERLGDSFNQMIAALAESRQEVRKYQEELEGRIRQRTEALEEAMKRAKDANRAKSDFLANMSHELRTPMNGILGMIDIVLDSSLEDQQREELIAAKECSFSLLALLNDILDLSRIEAGKMNLEEIAFASRDLVEDCRKAVLPRAREKGLELVCDVAHDVPEELVGDPLRLRQILVNLLGNAIKFTHHGSVRLHVSSGPEATPQQVTVNIDVIDTGVGIPEEKLPLIFAEFTQADGSVTREYGGSGLGLAITKKLVEMHGGRIWAESTVGKGSAFHVALRLSRAAPTGKSLHFKEKAGDTSTRSPETRHSGRILVVEDNKVNQKVVAGLLSKRGYEIRVANHGREALEALVEVSFDLVLMDIQMPVLDGFEATRTIRGDPRWSELPIVGLTAHAMRGDRERCLEAGMDDYLTKPVQPRTLFATVEKYLDRQLATRGS